MEKIMLISMGLKTKNISCLTRVFLRLFSLHLHLQEYPSKHLSWMHLKKKCSIRTCCRLHKQEGEHTDLLLSQSESLLKRLRIDQRECLLREELRDHERDGGRRSTEGLLCSSSSTLETTGGDGDARDGLWLLSSFPCSLPQRFFDMSS